MRDGHVVYLDTMAAAIAVVAAAVAALTTGRSSFSVEFAVMYFNTACLVVALCAVQHAFIRWMTSMFRFVVTTIAWLSHPSGDAFGVNFVVCGVALVVTTYILFRLIAAAARTPEPAAGTRVVVLVQRQDCLETCTICMDEEREVCLTHCGHAYCTLCITQWVAAHDGCPTCRRSLSIISQ